jgi:hypothetical protein
MMNKQQLQQLKQHLGADLINYALNPTDVTHESDLESLEITELQSFALKDMHQKIQEARVQYITDGGYGDGANLLLRMLTHEDDSIFNHYRKICGGQDEISLSNDPVIEFLQKICIHKYPDLLLKSTSNHSFSLVTNLNVGMKDYQNFISLVKNDPLLNSIKNKKDELEYSFELTTEDGLQFNTQVCMACTTLITRAFYDSCSRMDYSLNTVLKTIAEHIDILRDLANGMDVHYSSFIGLRGIRFIDFNEVIFNGAVLRQFGGMENPSPHTQRTVISHSDDYSKYSGHILEVTHTTKLCSHQANCNTTNSMEASRFQQDILEKVLFSLIFSSESTRGPSPSFFEIGFPLINPGNFGHLDQYPAEYLLLDQTASDAAKNWFSILRDKPIGRVKIPLQRLKYAIFERRNPEDAIVDAITAWEGMFSQAYETTFKVTGSLAKYLSDSANRPEMLKRLKGLYDLRSNLVHGKTSKDSSKEDIESIRSEVVRIGLNCLKKLLQDDRLLLMSPTERVNDLLVLTE